MLAGAGELPTGNGWAYEVKWRAARARGEEPRCGDCRGYRPPVGTEQHRRWWLDRYSLDEIPELAGGLDGWD